MMPPADPPIIFLMGPTAAGKTALALALHDALPVDIISVDSSQVYRGMDIGTAKPTREEQRRVPHRLIDIRDPTESYSAANFREDALREMAAITAVGRIPLLVGGAMFYFHALESGLSELPSADTEVRRILNQEAEHLGWPALHSRLQGYDPQTAKRIHPNDAQRIQRALEIIEITGQAPSALARQAPPRSLPYRLVKIAIFPADRRQLHEKIARRFESMFELGLVAEVEALKQRGDLSLQNPSVRTVGYRQIWEYLTGQVDCYEMVQRGIAATRQFAKRQLTWLRHYQGVTLFDSEREGLIQQCKDFVRRQTA